MTEIEPMVVTLKDFIESRAGGKVPMVGRNRLRAGFYALCLNEHITTGVYTPCLTVEGGHRMPAMCEGFDEADEWIEPLSWDQFFSMATQDLQMGILRDWLVLYNDALYELDSVPKEHRFAVELGSGSKLEALAWLRSKREEAKEMDNV
jgi:hypothetical protein